MVVIKNYRMLAVDVEDFTRYREFTCPLKLHAWTKQDANKDRSFDIMTPQEYRWLMQQPASIKQVKANNKKRRTKIVD